jgi:multidrug efflux pump subunit AcrA (membrane-fusion protein)
LATGEEAAISREQLEAAQSKAAADEAALALAQHKSEAAFGLNSPFRSSATRAGIMHELASGAAVLVRVTFPGDAGPMPRQLIITRMGADAKSWTTTTIWNAPADASVPGRSYYAILHGSDLAQNERVTAAIPSGAPQAGTKIPANAVVFGESEAWVYVQTAARTFVRSKVDTSRPMGDGYFVTTIKPGDKVVMDGAGLLLAHEVNPSTEAED